MFMWGVGLGILAFVGMTKKSRRNDRNNRRNDKRLKKEDFFSF